MKSNLLVLSQEDRKLLNLLFMMDALNIVRVRVTYNSFRAGTIYSIGPVK